MVDFRSALAAGLNMAQKVDLNKKEIGEKIKYISLLLSEGTFGKVKLVLGENSAHREVVLGNVVQNVFAVSQVDAKRWTKIATIIEDKDNGYPVVIEAVSSRFVCSMAEEIELAFSEIIQTTSVANAVFSLINDE